MEKLDVKTLNSPKDIPVGTLLIQHWLNSSSIYEVISTSAKSVVVLEVPTKRVRFEHDGGGTGTSYKVADRERHAQLKQMYADYGKKFDDKDFWPKKSSEMDKAVMLSNNRCYLIPHRIMVKPANGGGFYIPGVHRGSWCGNLNLFDESTEASDYYGD